jgi:hypothetical protein
VGWGEALVHGVACRITAPSVVNKLKIVENKRKNENSEDVPLGGSSLKGLDSPKLFENLTILRKVLIRPEFAVGKILKYDNRQI